MYLNNTQGLDGLGKFRLKKTFKKATSVFKPPPVRLKEMKKEKAKKAAAAAAAAAPAVAPQAPVDTAPPVELRPQEPIYYPPQPQQQAPVYYPPQPQQDYGQESGANVGWAGFFDWLDTSHPEITSKVDERGLLESPGSPFSFDRGGDSFEGLSAGEVVAPASPGWMDSILKLAAPLVQSYQQQKIFKAQMKRAQSGLPPLKTEEYVPPVRASIGIDTETLLPILGVVGAVGLAFFLNSRRNGRGR